MNKSSGVAEFLIKHSSEGPVSFHMPGHKGSDLYRKYGYSGFIEDFFDYDITEIAGADNLFQTEGIIRETMDKYRRLYGTKETYLLVNGSSSGIIASVLAAVPKGGGLVLARNCHKSVFNAMTIGNIRPVYAYPEVAEGYGIAGPVTPDETGRLLDENPDAAAVILPSPNYYGICSDIRSIAEEVHRRDRILIVDQAHGAHLKFMNNGSTCACAAEDCGADLVINSTHKTLASLTQSAILNVCSDRVPMRRLEDGLQIVESTSPSYILMGSLDINAEILLEHGDELMDQWLENLKYFNNKAKAINGLKIMDVPGFMDTTKINLDMSELGIGGQQLEEKLREYGIFAELATGNILMCMTGIGNSRDDFDRLLRALEDIAGDASAEMEAAAFADSAGCTESSAAAGTAETTAVSSPDKTKSDEAALWTKRRRLHEIPQVKALEKIDSCEGRICASSIIPYPPGIPLICPGEEIGREDIEYIKKLRSIGEKVMGIDGEGRVTVNRQ